LEEHGRSGLLAMLQRTSLLLDLFPGDGFYLAGLNLTQTARELCAS